jgi:triacylglycerol esterase/lipase EstA (alpha/beta hydrolase family)
MAWMSGREDAAVLEAHRHGPLSVLVISAAVVLATAPVAAQGALRVVYSSVVADAYASVNVNGPPPGANDFSCRPTAQHPYPVVLVPGTLENMAGNWYTLSSLLSNEGYCVFALNYGQEAGRVVGFPGALPPSGTGHIAASAGELAAFVERVLSASRRWTSSGTARAG